MILTRKIRIIPTKEQEEIFIKSAGVARWAWNYYLSEQFKQYEKWKIGTEEEKYIKNGVLRKRLSDLKKSDCTWLKEVSSKVPVQAMLDADEAFKEYFKGNKNKPKFKKKGTAPLKFYVRCDRFYKTQEGFKGEKLGIVKTSEPLPKLKNGGKYHEPRIKYDGVHWHLFVGYDVECKKEQLTEETLGIDVGVKVLAYCSNGKVYDNINKTKKIKKLKKRLKRENKRLSKQTANTSLGKNIEKRKNKINKLYNKLTNIRNNYLHQTTTEIVKTKPSRIVVENIVVSEMAKNKHLSEKIYEQKLHTFKNFLKYKSKLYGISFVEANRWFPSSKLCSKCGYIKKDLKLKDRKYKCNHCGLVIDRDFNASLNLASYQE